MHTNHAQICLINFYAQFFSMNNRDVTLAPYDCMEGTLPTEPFLQTLFIYLH